jgi:CubicO group peptidase (beta-lactamase class C family)
MTEFQRVHEILQEATGTEFTGAVARIEHCGRVVFERAYGVTRADELGRPVYCDTIFDLASLTKLFIATLSLQTIAAGVLELDETLARFIPEWHLDRHAAITARTLLAHTSGMNSGADYREIRNENVESFALRSELIAAPGERVIYSDLGFIALGVVLERAMGRSLSALVRGEFSRSLMFRPGAVKRLEIPATEDDGWRGRVQGFVHDEKAYLMAGSAGHAGLFGTAADVAALTESYLGAVQGRERGAMLPNRLVREAVIEQAYDPVLRRGLGWALKTNNENSCGRYMDFSSFGHTGFVGTCVWADPVRDVQGVLLTNAVYFGRNPATISEQAFRPRFYEAMIEDLVALSPSTALRTGSVEEC